MGTTVWLFFVTTTALTWTGCQSLLCACNTAACRDQGQTTCNATAMCYVQYLDLGDGSDPLIRGCIASKTPLLCENRRPAQAASWPVLVCCAHAPMCNRDAVPGNLATTPQKVASTTADHQTSTASPSPIAEADPKGIAAVYSSKNGESVSRHQQPLHPDNAVVAAAPMPSDDHSERGSTGSGGGLSAAYAALLAVACSLLVLVAGALALFLLRRRALSMTSGQYGAMHGGYFKGHAPRDCTDPEAPHSGLCSKRQPPSAAS